MWEFFFSSTYASRKNKENFFFEILSYSNFVSSSVEITLGNAINSGLTMEFFYSYIKVS